MAVHMGRAQQALDSCRLLLKEGDTAGACNRAYYAMFHAAHAALQSAGIIKPGVVYKTHAGLVSAFGKELVQTKKLPDQLGRSLSKVLNVRLLADYSGDPPETSDAEWSLDQAESFVAAIRSVFPSASAPPVGWQT